MNFRLSYRGVEIQVTNRDLDTKLQPYIEKFKTAVDWALDKGGLTAPEKRTFGGKKEIEYIPTNSAL